jgi:hypothetical protein
MSKTDNQALAKGALAIRKAEKEKQMALVPTSEQTRLTELEAIIKRGLGTFVAVGNALLEIRDSKLYKAEFETFELYCRERWNMSRIHAHRHIEAAKVSANLLPTGNIQPRSERQVRPLAKLKPTQQRKVWKEAVQSADGEQPTAKQVQEAAEPKRKPRQRREPPPYEPTPVEQAGMDALEKALKRIAPLATPEIAKVIYKCDRIEKSRWITMFEPLADIHKVLVRITR